MNKTKCYKHSDGCIRGYSEFEGQEPYIWDGIDASALFHDEGMVMRFCGSGLASTPVMMPSARLIKASRLFEFNEKQTVETSAERRARQLTPALGPHLAKFASGINIRKRKRTLRES